MEIALLAAMIAAIIVSVTTATVAGVQAEEAAQAASDAAKAQAKLQSAESEQTARQMRKDHARRLAIQRVQFGKAGVIAAVGTPLDVLSENAGQLEIEARSVELFGANALALGKASASSFQAGGSLAAAGAGLRGAGEVAGTIGSGIAAKTTATTTTSNLSNISKTAIV